MRTRLLGILGAGLVVSLGLAYASNQTPAASSSAGDINKGVAHALAVYPDYTIWDNVEYHVNGGEVELSGVVSEPVKKSDLLRTVQRIPGVTVVSDRIRVLPLSPMDNQLRWQVARAIYGDNILSRYAVGPLSPIHIIVDNGHVTLAGVVSTEMEKNVATMRASGAGLSFGPVVNNLVVENPPKKK